MILRLTCGLVDLYVIQTSHCYMAVAQQGHEKKTKKQLQHTKTPKNQPNYQTGFFMCHALAAVAF